jgi:hypothetical protein
VLARFTARFELQGIILELRSRLVIDWILDLGAQASESRMTIIISRDAEEKGRWSPCWGSRSKARGWW